MKDSNTIIIAHRLSTIRNADRVIAIENATVQSLRPDAVKCMSCERTSM
ncbi:MAG: hypothetical protein HQL05_08725 [Nitrospirae bacterium]|nr:hypothetical protein [Candidatus Magnetobacterium casensis]MBF0337903.1 hypothetical protein [Nitrospirota bacterium]